MRSTSLRVWLLAGVLLALAALPASACDPAKPHANCTTRTAARPQPFLPGMMGMVVAIDPETGMLGLPTPEQAAALARTATLSRAEEEMLSRSSVGLREFRLADGTVGLDLGGRFQEFSVAHIGPNGRVTFDCSSDLASVLRLLKHGPAAIAPAAPAAPAQPVTLEDR